MNATNRLSDFASRASHAPEHVVVHSSHGWRYIPVHPFADDHELLQRLDWDPEACIQVDAYWEYAEDVYFLQVGPAWSGGPTLGLYYRRRDNRADSINLVAVVRGGPIFRADFEALMVRFAEFLPLRGTEKKLTALVRSG